MEVCRTGERNNQLNERSMNEGKERESRHEKRQNEVQVKQNELREDQRAKNGGMEDR